MENVAPSSPPPAPARKPWRPLRAFDVQWYRLADGASGLLLLAMTLFAPWAFGATQPWSIRILNGMGLAVGALLAGKLYIRWAKGYAPPRWDCPATATALPPAWRWQRRLTRGLAGLTVVFLAYCLISALNARAVYHRAGQQFEYFPALAWLPQTLDRAATWQWCWNYLALAGAFWGLWDWLLGCTGSEARARRNPVADGLERPAYFLPERSRRFIWLLCLNGGLLALEGIIQRLEGSGRLLFLVKPGVNPDAITQFGPWAYRANAAAFFNLLWPFCLGYWWTLHRSVGFRQHRHHVLLLAAGMMAACPVIATCRAGAVVSLLLLVTALPFLWLSDLFLLVSRKPDRRTRWFTGGALGAFAALALWLALHFGWPALQPRLRQFDEGLSGREEMYENARPMAKDYVWFGTGAGTFEPVFQLYRKSLDTYWPAQLHNDWLETRITLGRVGLTLVLAALGGIFLRWFCPGGIHGGRRFTVLGWAALAGCLLHARYDFPFQIYSILLLFVSLCAVLFTQSRRP